MNEGGAIPPFFMSEYSFKKGERLSGKKTISSLFQSGRSVVSYPVRILYEIAETGPYPAAVAISVPKKSFKKAVDRNFLKRRIREAYRLYKPEFYSGIKREDMGLHLVILYQPREITDFRTIQEGVKLGLDKILQQITESPRK